MDIIPDIQMDTKNTQAKDHSGHSMDVENEEQKCESQNTFIKTKEAVRGVAGQLYESKLISLILYRLLKDKKVKEFYMGSNLSEIGDMDDICIRLVHVDSEKPLLILIQAKHKDHPEDGISDIDLYHHKSSFNLKKNFSSLAEVQKKFKKNDNVMFAGKLEDVIPYFIFYTQAVNCIADDRIKRPSGINIVKDLINTGSGGVFQINYNESDINNVLIESKNRKQYVEPTPFGRDFLLSYNANDIMEHSKDEKLTDIDIMNGTEIGASESSIDAVKRGSGAKKVITVTDTNEQRRKDAELFFHNLYFFTDQCEEYDVEKELQNEIGNHQVFSGTTTNFKLKSDALFLNFHKKVQRWWLMTDNVRYLTDKCDYLEKIIQDVFDKTYLSILHYNCMNDLDLYPITFNNEAMKRTTILLKDLTYEKNNPRKIIRIHSNSVVLTSLKLRQFCTQQTKPRQYSYIDYSYLLKIKEIEYKMLLEELRNTDVEILIIVCDTSVKENSRICDIIKEFDKKDKSKEKHSEKEKNKNIIIISEESQTMDIQNLHIDVVNDYIFGLLDIDNEKEILEYIITIQGVELSLNQVIYDKIKYIINADILLNILRHEKIDLGRSLSHNEEDQFYFDRKLVNDKTLLSLNTLVDVDNSIVIITAEPGMGKSTLLSNLAMNTKRLHPKTWIPRLNLQDYSKDFLYRWQKNNVEIDLRESMLLICKAELTVNMCDKVDMVLSTGCLKLIDLGLDPTSLFLMRMIVHCYNEGNLIFLLDGFDEICPNYEKETVEFIKNLHPTTNKDISSSKNDEIDKEKEVSMARHKVWITSRPYDSVKRTLEMFATPFFIASLDKEQQLFFYEQYFQDNIHNDYNISTVNNFMQVMAQRHNTEATLSSIPLRVLYKAAWDYFQSKGEMKNLSYKHDTAEQFVNNKNYEEAMHLSGIPLHMKIYANHFVNVIKDESEAEDKDKWNLDVHTFKFYESFLETKLRQIFFANKKRKNIYLADIRTRYDEAMEVFSKKHKQLAFYSFFHNAPINVLKCMGVGEIEEMIKKIIKGEEKTGLIYSISQGIPKFVHLAFAEYFAVEHVTDMLKKNTIVQKNLINFVLNWLLDGPVGLMAVFEHKLKTDAKLHKTLSNKANKNTIYVAMAKQFGSDKNTFRKALNNGLRTTVEVLIKSVVKLDHTKLTHFVEYIGGSFFIYSALFNNSELIKYVIEIIKEVDNDMVNNIGDIVKYEMNNHMNSKEVILDRLSNVGIKIDFNEAYSVAHLENITQMA